MYHRDARCRICRLCQGVHSSCAGVCNGQVGDKLLVHWTAAGPGAGDAEVHSLELPLDRFTQDTSSSGPQLPLLPCPVLRE